METIKKSIGEGFGKGETYHALAYDETDKFGGLAIKQVRFNPVSGSTAITIGDSTTAITLATYAQRAISIYTTCASTDGANTVLPVYINATMSGQGGVGRAFEAKLTVTGKLGGWGNAIKGYTDVTLTSAATTGLISAICAELKLPNATLAGGVYAVLELEWVGQTNTNTQGALTGAHTTLIYANVGGDTATDFDSNGYILEIEGMTAGSGKAYYNETLRIGIGDNIRYLPLSTAQGTYTTSSNIVTSGTAILILGGIDADAGEGVGSVIQMGTSGTPLTSSEDETEGISCYFESSGKNIYGMRMQVEKTSATAGAPRALTLRSILSHSSGFSPQGANAVDARVTLEAGSSTNTGISGEMHAMESQCRVDTATRSLNGTYAAHKFTNNFAANNTMPAASTFFLRFRDEGSVKTPALFELSGHTVGTNNLFSTDPSDKTNGAVNATLKINVGGTSYWIPLWDVVDGT